MEKDLEYRSYKMGKQDGISLTLRTIEGELIKHNLDNRTIAKILLHLRFKLNDNE